MKPVSLIAHMSNLVKVNGGINLAQGIPGFAPPEELVQMLSNVLQGEFHQYPPGIGNAKLLDAIIKLYEKHVTLSSENLLITQGATEAITLVYMLINQRWGRGWTSMSMDPAYESFVNLPRIFNNNFISLPYTENYQIDWHSFEQLCSIHQIKLFFLNSPGNPMGRSWSRAETLHLIELSKKFDFYIIADAVYSDLHFGSESAYLPLDCIHEKLFFVNSFSKMLSITGWRVGFLVGNKEDMDTVKQIHDYTGLCASSLIQEAIAGFMLHSSKADDYLQVLRSRLETSYLFLSEKIDQMGFTFPPVNAGYFIWAKLPESFQSGFDFAMDLYEKQKVAVVPGIHFSNHATNFVRFSFARPLDELSEACARINKYLSA